MSRMRSLAASVAAVGRCVQLPKNTPNTAAHLNGGRDAANPTAPRKKCLQAESAVPRPPSTKQRFYAGEATANAPSKPHPLRLSKLIADRGQCSRREADEWIAGGRVRVDGKVVDKTGARVRPDARIELDSAPSDQPAGLPTCATALL